MQLFSGPENYLVLTDNLLNISKSLQSQIAENCINHV